MKQFPVGRAQGSNYEVGLTIGRQMRLAIANVLARNRRLFAKELSQYLEESKLFFEQAQQYFPQYVAELRGIADGAQVPFAELFLSNNREVANPDPGVVGSGHCTIIGIPQGDGYLLGHNEDWDQSSLEELYILDAQISGIRIFGLNYASNVIGASVAINSFGLVEAVNELSHQDSQLGVPKNFIARALLDCQTLEEAEVLMRTVPRASGFNHVLVQGRRLWNIESSAKEYAIEKVEQQKYVHTNHYLTELSRIDTQVSPETRLRYQKVKQLLSAINTVEDLQRCLSDRSEPRVCREETIGSVIFDTMHRAAYIAYGQSNPESYYQVALG